ncbi:MAG: phosphate signaling complex protein PhoU [Telmatospirillum sp.]|nr:phosphate signaling complex protein PhoU [Telmatospirillum sp.]
MPHIVKSFDDELNRLRETLLSMGELAVAQFRGAMTALIERDVALAREGSAGDINVDGMEHAINEQGIRMLALRAPFADELRTVVAALKVSQDLERIADYAANIAKRSLLLSQGMQLPSVRAVQRLGTLVERQLAEVAASYRERDADRALAVWHSDLPVDEAYSGLFRELLTYMLEDPHAIGPASHLLFIAKNIERIGDHATNISEMVYFVITGGYIEGTRPKGVDADQAASADADGDGDGGHPGACEENQ